MSNTDKDFELCMRVENVILPKNGYFGVSAATGIGTNYYFHLFLPFVKFNRVWGGEANEHLMGENVLPSVPSEIFFARLSM